MKALVVLGVVFFISCFAAMTNSQVFTTVTPYQLQKMLDDGSADLIDVRETDEFVEEHINRAKNIPLRIVDNEQLVGCKRKIVVQCKSGKRGEEACLKLKQQCSDLDLSNLEGGITQWKTEKFETVASGNLPIMRQVQIIAGALIVIGGVAAILFGMLFLSLPILIGVGLIFAGVTGWCGLAKLLAMMPWN